MSLFWFGIGLVILVIGAEALVRGASRLALTFGISPLVVGLTVVAFGTSAPELAVSVQSVHAGRVDIAIGNVVGSNIFNILFILGLSAMITPLIVNQQLIRQEVPIMIGVSLLFWVLVADGGLQRWDGALLLLLLVTYTVFLIRQSRRETAEVRAEFADAFDVPERKGWDASPLVQLLLVGVGLALLVLGAQLLVDSAVTMARLLGVSELVIGLTVVAAGTSLPEVATSVLAALRGQRDIAVGNVVGSNIFNILCVAGVSAAVAPGPLTLAPSVLSLDLPVMLAVTIACLPIFFTGNLIARWEGVLLFSTYLAYTAYLVMVATGAPGLEGFRTVLTLYLIPLVVLILVMTVVRQFRGGRRRPPPG